MVEPLFKSQQQRQQNTRPPVKNSEAMQSVGQRASILYNGETNYRLCVNSMEPSSNRVVQNIEQRKPARFVINDDNPYTSTAGLL